MAVATSPRFIESIYHPDQLVTAGPGRRMAGASLDVLLLVVTLFIGWFVWFAIVARNGQSPGKQLVGTYIIRADGTRAGGGFTWLRDIVVQWLLFNNVLAAVTFGIAPIVAGLWCIWDKDRQCLWDKVADTYVAWSPGGFKPLTRGEHRRIGAPLPIARAPEPPPPPAAQEGPPLRTGAADVADQLRELNRLHDKHLISDEEFETRRARLLEQL